MMRAFEAHPCRHRSQAGRCAAPFFGALDALAVNDGCGRAGVATRLLAAPEMPLRIEQQEQRITSAEPA